jgi:prepilin-type N-terminal cleavage/methylation domain-containing protein
MYATNKTKNRRGFTLVELLVVMAIILAVAALAAAFAPRVTDSTNLTRSVDQLEQWLLTAKMRAKRDGLATGLRFVQAPGDTANTYSQFQYIQQPDPLAGGWLSTTQTSGAVLYSPGPPPVYLTGGILTGASAGLVAFGLGVDFSLGVANPAQWLVQAGDFLELRDGGVYLIAGVVPPAPSSPATTLKLAGTAYDNALTITQPTTNYRILRQPRLLEGEPVLQMPGNFAVDNNTGFGNVQAGPSTNIEILFSPSGAVVGANAGNGKVLMMVYDTTQTYDSNKAGIVAVQSRTGFVGAYSVAPPPLDPFLFAEEGRTSGL